MREVHLNNRLSRDFPSGKGAGRRGGAAGCAAAAAGCLRPHLCPCLGVCTVGRRCSHTFKGKGLEMCLLSDNLQHTLVLAVLEYSVGKVLGSRQGGSPHTDLPPRHSTGTRSPLVPTQSVTKQKWLQFHHPGRLSSARQIGKYNCE